MPKTHLRFLLAGVVSALVLSGALLVPASASAQSADQGRLFVRGYGGGAFGTANNGGDSVRSGLFGGGIGLNLTSRLSVIGDVGYMTNVATEEGATALRLVTSLITLVSGVAADVTLEARTLSVMGGGRFALRGGAVRFKPFVEGEAGMTRSTFSLKITEADATVVSDATDIFKNVIGKTSSTSPAVAAGGGFDFAVSHAVAAEVGYHYLRLFGDAKANIHQLFGGLRVSF